MYILRDVLVDGENQAPNADMAWPEPLRPRSLAPTPVWLVTTDDHCARATEQAQLRTKWVIVQVRAGQPRPRGLPRGTTLLVATLVPHDPHITVHTLEDESKDAGHLVVHMTAWEKKPCGRGLGTRMEPMVRNNARSGDLHTAVRRHLTGGVGATHPASAHGDSQGGP